MTEDDSQLEDYREGKFSQIESRFGEVDDRLDGMEKAFESVDGRLNEVERGMGQLQESFRHLQDVLARYVEKAGSYYQETEMLAEGQNRHERWIRRLAEEQGVELDESS